MAGFELIRFNSSRVELVNAEDVSPTGGNGRLRPSISLARAGESASGAATTIVAAREAGGKARTAAGRKYDAGAATSGQRWAAEVHVLFTRQPERKA